MPIPSDMRDLPTAWLKQMYQAGTRHLPEVDRAKLRVVNLLAMLGVVLSLLYTALYGLVFLSPVAAGLNAVFVLGYAVYFVVLRHRAGLASRLWLAGVYVVQIAVFSLWGFPRESGYHLFVIAGIPLSFLVFVHPYRWWRGLTVALLLGIFYATEMLDTPKFFGHLPQAYVRISYLTVMPLITVLVAVVLQSFLNELHQRDEALRLLAVTDPLTGVANRRGLLERAEGMESHARRVGMPLCVLMVDIDHFKAVNDQHGHEVGDRLLAAVARALRENIRKEDALGRMGGEEFAVVLFNATLADGLNTAQHLRRRVSAVRVPDDQLRTMSCTVSLGVAALVTADEHLNRTLARADQALYRAKAEGRNRVCGHPFSDTSAASGTSTAPHVSPA